MVNVAIIIEEVTEEGLKVLTNQLPDILTKMGFTNIEIIKYHEFGKKIIIELVNAMKKHKKDTAHIIDFGSPVILNKKEVEGIILLDDSNNPRIGDLLGLGEDSKRVVKSPASNKSKISISERVDRDLCLKCAEKCDRIECLSPKGRKPYCCPCYGKFVEGYTREKWCQTCQNRHSSSK